MTLTRGGTTMTRQMCMAAVALSLLAGAVLLSADVAESRAVNPSPPNASGPPVPAQPSRSPSMPKRPPAKKPPTPAAKKGPFGDACRQVGKRRDRDCPEWVDYAAILIYKGREESKTSDSEGLVAKETRTIDW